MSKQYDLTGSTPSDIDIVTRGSRSIYNSENKWCEYSQHGVPVEVLSLAEMRENYDSVEVVTDPSFPPQNEYWVSGSIGGDGAYCINRNVGNIHVAKKLGKDDLYFVFGSNEEQKKDLAEAKAEKAKIAKEIEDAIEIFNPQIIFNKSKKIIEILASGKVLFRFSHNESVIFVRRLAFDVQDLIENEYDSAWHRTKADYESQNFNPTFWRRLEVRRIANQRQYTILHCDKLTGYKPLLRFSLDVDGLKSLFQEFPDHIDRKEFKETLDFLGL